MPCAPCSQLIPENRAGRRRRPEKRQNRQGYRVAVFAWRLARRERWRCCGSWVPALQAEYYTGKVKIESSAIPLLTLLVCAIVAIEVSSNPSGFVSDDFIHLVEDSGQAWYFSSDHLYRPLRNGVFKLMPALLGLNRVAYSILITAFYLLALGLFWRLGQRFGLRSWAAGTAAAIAFLSPRNHALLFWFATFQDLVAVVCLLGILLCWIQFRNRSDSGLDANVPYSSAILLFAVAIGMKETAIVYPALVLATDVFLRWESRAEWRPSWKWCKPYLGFSLPVLVFIVFVYWYPDGQFRFQQSQGDLRSVYGQTGIAGVVLAEIKSLAHTITPFGGALVYRNPDPMVVLGIGFSLAFFAFVAWWSKRFSLWIWALAWCCFALAPTSVFARSVLADYYLFTAQMAVALATAASIQALPLAATRRKLILAALGLIFLVGGASSLIRQGREWSYTAAEANRVGQSIAAQTRGIDKGQVMLVGVPHSDFDKPILNNGIRGCLRLYGAAAGIDWHVLHDIRMENSEASKLRAAMGTCATVAGAAPNAQVVVDVVNPPRAYKDDCRVRIVLDHFAKNKELWY